MSKAADRSSRMRTDHLESAFAIRRASVVMCVSAGKSEGEIAWRRCKGIGSRGHVVGWLERRSLDTSASVRGQNEKMGV